MLRRVCLISLFEVVSLGSSLVFKANMLTVSSVHKAVLKTVCRVSYIPRPIDDQLFVLIQNAYTHTYNIYISYMLVNDFFINVNK